MKADRFDRIPLRSLVLLLALLALILEAPILAQSRGTMVVFELSYLVVFCVAGYLLNSTRRWVLIYLSVAVPAFLVGLVTVTPMDTPVLEMIRDILLLCLQLLMIIAILRFALLNDRARDFDRIIAGICGYLTLGLLWAKLYSIHAVFSPGAFLYSNGTDASGEDVSLLYFSLITLTTTGYGDITPAKPFARILSALEAVAGTLYLAILIASLLSGRRFSRKKAGKDA